jgi:hypothetical protein
MGRTHFRREKSASVAKPARGRVPGFKRSQGEGNGRAMRAIYSYARLFLASWLFLGGVAVLFGPSAAAVARDARWRERQLQTIPRDQRAQWVEDRDIEDARTQAYVRLLGVLVGGLGFGAALRETAYLCTREGR